MHGDEVGTGEQIVQRYFLDTHFNRALLGQERVIGDDFHPEADRAFRDDRTDIAGTDQAKRLAGQLDTHEFGFFPLAGLGRRIGRWQLARQSEHQCDGMLRGGDAVAEWRVHDHDALGGGRRNIDIVDADAGAADHFQIGRCRQNFWCDSCRGADGEAVIFADDLHQLFRRLAGDFIHFASALAENLSGFRVHFVGYKYFWHILDSLSGQSGRRRPASRAISA